MMDSKGNDCLDLDHSQNGNSGYNKHEMTVHKKAFKDTDGCKALVGVLVTLAVAAIVIPLSVCLIGHCGGGTDCSLDCSDEHPHWDYGSDGGGPECWSDCFPTCGAMSQSPIDLDSSVRVDIAAGNITTLLYDVNQSISLFNNGHTVQGDLSVATSISGLGLPGTYLGQQFHFHWGTANNKGSEHTEDGEAYPMELHIVHYSDKYANFDEAADEFEGLAVFGVLFEIDAVDNPHYDTIISQLQQVPYADDRTVLYISIDDLLGGVDVLSGSYYRYNGSLTTPPCHESVVWTVFTTTVPISETQISAFRNLYSGDVSSHKLYDNFRPVMPRGSRQLYYAS